MVMKITERRRLASAEMAFALIELLVVKSSKQNKNHKLPVPFCHSADIMKLGS
jgi:hypothetical protein